MFDYTWNYGQSNHLMKLSIKLGKNGNSNGNLKAHHFVCDINLYMNMKNW